MSHSQGSKNKTRYDKKTLNNQKTTKLKNTIEWNVKSNSTTIPLQMNNSSKTVPEYILKSRAV